MARSFEHHFRRTIPGGIDSVRRKLSDVLESFGYVVLGDSPIQAKRPREKSIWVAMVLEYDTALTIALKPISSASTLATFDYSLEQLFTKGEMQALEREVEAIIAMATSSSVEVFCPSCGVENAGKARFCRSCGKPASRSQLPAELEVMRLTANASGSQIELTLGLSISLLALLASLAIILFAGSVKGIVFGWILLVLGELLGAYFLILGMHRLHRSLNPLQWPWENSQVDKNTPAQLEAQSEQTRSFSSQDKVSLPPRPVSIVEGTTELMNHQPPATIAPVRDTDTIE